MISLEEKFEAVEAGVRAGDAIEASWLLSTFPFDVNGSDDR